MPVKKGDLVAVEYTGSLHDGTVFDSSEANGEPLDFKVGEGQLLKAFEDAIIGMSEGDEVEIELESKDAYGPLLDDLVQEVPKKDLGLAEEIKPGVSMVLELPNGIQIPAKVVEVTDEFIKIDMNHPLAGKDIKFKIKLVKILHNLNDQNEIES